MALPSVCCIGYTDRDNLLIDTNWAKPIEITEVICLVFDLLTNNIVWRAIDADEVTHSQAGINGYLFAVIKV